MSSSKSAPLCLSVHKWDINLIVINFNIVIFVLTRHFWQIGSYYKNYHTAEKITVAFFSVMASYLLCPNSHGSLLFASGLLA